MNLKAYSGWNRWQCTYCYCHGARVEYGRKRPPEAMRGVGRCNVDITRSHQTSKIFASTKYTRLIGTIDVRSMCPTTWTTKRGALGGITRNYTVLQTLVDEEKSVMHDTEAKVITYSRCLVTNEDVPLHVWAILGGILMKFADSMYASIG